MTSVTDLTAVTTMTKKDPELQQIINEVRFSNIFIQYDIYHMQVMEGDLARNLQRHLPRIGHVQLADNPGRNEPGTGEMNYKNIFKHIYNKGYKGVMGMEHGNAGKGKEGELALIKAYREADDFV